MIAQVENIVERINTYILLLYIVELCIYAIIIMHMFKNIYRHHIIYNTYKIIIQIYIYEKSRTNYKGYLLLYVYIKEGDLCLFSYFQKYDELDCYVERFLFFFFRKSLI